MKPHLRRDWPRNDTVLVRSMDEYLALKHGGGAKDVALAALYRDRYGDDCAAHVCDQAADVALIILNQPAIVIPFCDNHARQMREEYSDLADHLPKLSPETKAVFPESIDTDPLSALLTTRPDPIELRDDDEP